jgi:hypothetical protein
LSCLSFPIPRRNGNSYQALPATRHSPDGHPLMAVSGVAVILHRFVVFHQPFTIFMGN